MDPKARAMPGSEEWTLRPARRRDAAVLGRVHTLCWRETYRDLLPEAMLSRLSAADRAATWRAVLAAPGDADAMRVWLVEEDGAIVGFGSCGPQRSRTLAKAGYDGEVSTLYLLKRVQRRGIGSALLRALATELAAGGCGAASLWVLKQNQAARRFYERRGGVLLAEVPGPNGRAGLAEVAYGWRDLVRL